MKTKLFFCFIFFVLGPVVTLALAAPKETKITSRLSAYEGKLFSGTQDSDYSSYNKALRSHIAKRIERQFGIALDPKTYSGIDLLEIEAFFKCKKSNEPFDLFLNIFPKQP